MEAQIDGVAFLESGAGAGERKAEKGGGGVVGQTLHSRDTNSNTQFLLPMGVLDTPLYRRRQHQSSCPGASDSPLSVSLQENLRMGSFLILPLLSDGMLSAHGLNMLESQQKQCYLVFPAMERHLCYR